MAIKINSRVDGYYNLNSNYNKNIFGHEFFFNSLEVG